jgi:hypothetical protein
LTSVLVAILVLPVLFLAVIVLATIPFRDVTRSRVTSFAYRQSLPITVANGPIVIRYLATTRRWRGCGLLLTVAGGVLEAWIRQGNLRIGTVALFVGWFVGAVIAEWRVSVLSTETSRRTALLAPRRMSSYLAGYVRWPIGILFLILISSEVLALLLTSHRGALLGWFVVTVSAGGVTAAVARHVLTRAQPRAASYVLASDESIRSRSLHVLAGSMLAIVGYLGAAIVALTIDDAAVRGALSVVLGIAFPIAGVLVARKISMLPARELPAEAPELTKQ